MNSRLRKSIRSTIRAIVPLSLRSARWARISRKHNVLANKLFQACNKQVISGPFKGMVYIDQAAGSMLGPKLLGTYELEIAHIIAEIAKTRYDEAIVIGAAEGYYAVGLLHNIPQLHVTSYDTDANSHALVSALAAANGCADRISVKGSFHDTDLSERDKDRATLLVVDVDGAEIEILDPERQPLLRQCDVLVETHDFLVPQATEELIERFTPSHEITRIASQPRRLSELPQIAGFSRKELLELANEHRPQQEWLWMTTNARSAQS